MEQYAPGSELWQREQDKKSEDNRCDVIQISCPFYFCVLHHLLLSVDVVLCVSVLYSPVLHYTHSSTPGRMQVVCGSWICWLFRRIRSGAVKLGGGWEKDNVQRMAKCYDDAGHSKYVGLRLLLLDAVIMTVRALPPLTNSQTWNDKETRHGSKKLGTLGRVMIRSSIVRFQPVTYYFISFVGYMVYG